MSLRRNHSNEKGQKKRPVRDLMKKVYRKKPWNQAVTFIAGTLVFITTYMLILPAITMTKPVLDCPYVTDQDQEAIILHQHDAACYNDNGELICTLPERKIHVHDDSCYEEVVLGYETIPLAQAIEEGRLDDAGVTEAAVDSLFYDNAAAGEGAAAVNPSIEDTAAADAAGEMPTAGSEQVYNAVFQDQLFADGEFSDGSGMISDPGNMEQVNGDTASYADSQNTDSISAVVDESQYTQNIQGLDSRMVTVPIIEKRLICGREELNPELHVHDDSCYEIVVTENDDGSITEERILTCTKPVAFFHQHGEECFKKAGSEDIIVYDEETQDSQDFLPQDNGQEIVIYDEPQGEDHTAGYSDDNLEATDDSRRGEDTQDAFFSEDKNNQANVQADSGIIEYFEPSPVIVEEQSGSEKNDINIAAEDNPVVEENFAKNASSEEEPVAQAVENENTLAPKKIEKKDKTESTDAAVAFETATDLASVITTEAIAESSTEVTTENATEVSSFAVSEEEENSSEASKEDVEGTDDTADIENADDEDGDNAPGNLELSEDTDIAEGLTAAEENDELNRAQADTETETVSKFITETTTEATSEAVSEVTSEISTEAVSETVYEATTEITTETVTESVSELPAEIATETTNEPVSELTTEMAKETVSELVSEMPSEITSEAITEAFNEISSEAVREIFSEAATEATIDFLSEVSSEAASETATETAAQVSSEAAIEVKTELFSEASSEITTELFSTVSSEAPTEVTTAVLIYDGEDYHVRLTYDSNSGIPEDAKLYVSEIDPESEEYELYLAQAKAALGLDDSATLKKNYARFFDITIQDKDGNEIQPDNQVKVEIIYDQPVVDVNDENVNASVLHFDEKKNAEVLSTLDAGAEEGVEVSMEGTNEGSIEASGEASDTVEETGSPYGSESLEGSDPINASDSSTMDDSFFENTEVDFIVSEESNKTDVTDIINAASIETFSVGDNYLTEASNTELTETDQLPDNGIAFTTDSFSVFGIIYTVDFHWEVDGKTYDFSIPGGGFVSFEHVVEVLGIASADENSEKRTENAQNGTVNEDEFVGEVPGVDEVAENGTTYEEAIKLNEVEVSEATKKFVADVESVEFSDPELVWVGKVDSESTVGGIKESKRLGVQYSAELTEGQIAEINAQTVEAGDWALISVQPFTSEESLTVIMKNGDQFVVRVTDGQDATEVSDIDTDGFYVIYVDQYYNNTHHYYALRNDGASVAVPNNDLDALGGEYVWQFGYDETACWWYNGSNYVEPEWTIVVGDNPDGRYLWIEKRGSGFGIHGNYWSDNYLSWDSSNGFKIVHTGFDVPIKVYERDKPRLNFNVAVNNQSYGSVSCSNTVTDLNWKNAAPIVATPADGCYFVGWRRGDEVLTGYSSTIPVGGIDITADNQVLTAVFAKNYTSPATQEINEWVDSLLGNPLESDKTAHVHDYDNRIYEIDLSASSSRYTIDQDIRIEFITDISRSMYFPETLLNEQDFTVNGQINLGQWLLDNGDPDQVYYVIGDINNTATMYAVYFSGNNYFTRWSIVDASYYLPYDNASTSGRIKTVCEISNGRTTINMTDRFDGNANRIFTGKIYNSTPKPPKDTADWDRLSYLTAAVNAVSRAIYRLDPGAEIGLVTFATSASGGTLYGAEDEASFISALQSIQPTGGTNQTSAFNLINNSNPPVFSLNSGKRQVALLITDGAPQGTSWDAIERAAGITEGNDVEIWTLGLALDRVGNNKQRLMNLASDGGYSGNAEDPDQLVTETKKILQEMLVKATVIGEVYDTVDPAFYPVDSSGNPIEEGFYYADTVGGSVTRHSSAPSDVKKSYYRWVNDNGTWSIAYYNQEIKWPEDGAWKESFYIKAKEDFMGGNTISTNSGVDNRVEANRVKHSGSPEGYYWLNQDHSSFRVDYETPYVNVDELCMSENSTEWTVYLGTEVDPEEELRELWDKIRVNLVVKKNGINGDTYTVTNGNQMYYSDDLLNDAGSPDGTSNESLPLSHFVNTDLIETLLRQIKNGETTASSSLIYRYFPYGHSIIGTFELSLEKTVNQAAAEDDAPKQHETKETGQEKELYTLKLRYIPVSDNASEVYEHTTPGKSAGKVADGYNGTTGELIDSENTHKIHVYAKTVEVEKLRPTSEDTTGTLTIPAKFGIYRQWKESDGEDNKKSLAGYKLGTTTLTDEDYYFLVEEQITNEGFAKFTKGLSAADDPYYLVETEPPTGYQHDKVLKTITITPGPDIKTDLDGDATTTMPYNWAQGVKLSVDGEQAVYVDESGDQIIPDGSGEERDYLLPSDEDGYFKTSVLNTPVGYLKVEKQVTYNYDAPTTDGQKSALAGTYSFKIYTDQTCEHAYKVDGEDLKLEITIEEDGTAVQSEIVELPLGNYWLKETESTNAAMFPVSDNPMSITITDNDTKTAPLVKSFVNNYDENKDPDKITLDIEKTFTGLQKASHIPDGFKIVLTYQEGNETKTINLVKDELEVESDGAKVRWSESEDGFTWHWHITSLPSEATNFKLHEEKYDEAAGYDWKLTILDGEEIESPDLPSYDHSLSVTPPIAIMTEVTGDRIEPDNNKNYKVYETDVILISLTGNHGEHGTLVVSQRSLNTKQRDAITAKIPQLTGSWKTPCYFFSIEEHPEGFYYKSNDVTFTWNESKKCYIVHVEHKQSSMEEVFLVSYDSQESVNNADLVNEYEEIPIIIDIEKIKKDNETVKLPGAVFELRQIKDEEPGNGGTYASEDGTETKTSEATDSEGKTSFTGLIHGYYELTEKTAPTGYVKTSESTTAYFKIEAGKVTWLVKGSGKPSTWAEREMATGDMVTFEAAKAAVEDNPETQNVNEAENATRDTFIIQNEPGAALPNTGGPGTNFFYMIGCILTLLAGTGIVMKKRRRVVT